MTRILKSLFATLLLSTLASTFAHAQARTFVSTFGNDTNPCSTAAPCRTLQRGIDVVAAGGDVLIVDAGGFGANVTVAKSVSIFAPPGGQSRLAVASDQTAITVNGAGISVSISNLGITGAAGFGVFFTGGTSLSLSNLDINVGGSFGVLQEGGAHLTMANTLIRNSNFCVFVRGTSDALARATLAKSRFENCGTGLYTGNYSIVSVEASLVVGEPAECLFGLAVEGPQSTMTLDGVVASNCFYGIYGSNNGATVTVSNALLTANDNAGQIFSNAAGRSYGNNRIFGNGTNALTGFTSIAEQ